MSPKNKKKLYQIRKKLDNLDNSLINVIKKRTDLVKEVLKLKAHKNQIVDHRRIREILKEIRIKSVKNKIDKRLTNKIWKSMIWSYVDFQKRNFRKK